MDTGLKTKFSPSEKDTFYPLTREADVYSSRTFLPHNVTPFWYHYPLSPVFHLLFLPFSFSFTSLFIFIHALFHTSFSKWHQLIFSPREGAGRYFPIYTSAFFLVMAKRTTPCFCLGTRTVPSCYYLRRKLLTAFMPFMTGPTISCLPWRIVPSLSTCHDGGDCLPSSCRGVRDWLLSWLRRQPPFYQSWQMKMKLATLLWRKRWSSLYLSPNFLSWWRKRVSWLPVMAKGNLSLDYLSWRRRLFVISRKTILSPWEKYPVSIMSITCNEKCDDQNNYPTVRLRNRRYLQDHVNRQ